MKREFVTAGVFGLVLVLSISLFGGIANASYIEPEKELANEYFELYLNQCGQWFEGDETDPIIEDPPTVWTMYEEGYLYLGQTTIDIGITCNDEQISEAGYDVVCSIYNYDDMSMELRSGDYSDGTWGLDLSQHTVEHIIALGAEDPIEGYQEISFGFKIYGDGIPHQYMNFVPLPVLIEEPEEHYRYYIGDIPTPKPEPEPDPTYDMDVTILNPSMDLYQSWTMYYIYGGQCGVYVLSDLIYSFNIKIQIEKNSDDPIEVFAFYETGRIYGYINMVLVGGDYRNGIWECSFDHGTVKGIHEYQTYQNNPDLPYEYEDYDAVTLFIRAGDPGDSTPNVQCPYFYLVYNYSEIDPSNPHPWLNTDIIIPIIVIGFVATAVGGFIVTQRLSNTLPKRFKPSR